nr:uncharacterized protein LOC104118591 isoform X2 [Nicotiana tomentosiformis]
MTFSHFFLPFLTSFLSSFTKLVDEDTVEEDGCNIGNCIKKSLRRVGMFGLSRCNLYCRHRWPPFPLRTPHPVDGSNLDRFLHQHFCNRVLGCLQGIELDYCTTLGGLAVLFRKFLNLSTQESIQDPIYFVLLRRQKKNETEQRRKCSLLTARILSLVLGCLMLGTLIYTIVTDGSPFRRDVFTPWLSATLVDFYVNIVALSVWVAYKESSWLSAAFWIILLICFGSISTCAYIALQLFSLSSQDPVYLILFSSRNRNSPVL